MIALYNPHVEMEQYSKANIWVRNGPDAETNSIEVGWAVSYHFLFSVCYV